MAKFRSLKQYIAAKEKEMGNNPVVKLVYTAPYAAEVHEDTTAFRATGQSKYVTDAEENLRETMNSLLVRLLSRGVPYVDAMEQVLELLMVASQQLVPVQTGFLRDSAEIQVESR